MKRLTSALGDRSALYGARLHHGEHAARSRWRGRERMTENDNYRELTTTTRAWTGDDVDVGLDDNYRGGDDNYPRLVVKIGAVGREEGRGRNRQE
jgi:hypothetical protein